MKLALAFLHRDRKLMTREPGMLTDLGVLLVMSAFLPVLIAPSIHDQAGIGFAILLGAVLFVSVELGFELGSRAFPLERFGMHWLLCAPLSERTVIGARYLSSWILTLPAVVLVAGIGTLVLGQGLSQFLAAVSIGFLLSGGAVPVGLATGVYLGRPDWRHPRQMLTLGGRLVLLIVLMGLAAWFLLILILSRTTQAVGGLELSVILPIWSGLFLFSATLAGVSFWVAGRRLKSLEWLH